MLKTVWIVISLLFACALSAQADQTGATQTLDPFVNMIRIPADATNFTLNRVKYTRVPTERTADSSQCPKTSSFEPGGSQFCPKVTDSKFAQAIQVDFSYNAASTADEFGNTYNEGTFYLDPTNFTESQLSQIPSHGALKGKKAQGVATLVSGTMLESTQVIDSAKSMICARTVVDGEWVLADASCNDKIAYKTIQEPKTVVAAVLK